MNDDQTCENCAWTNRQRSDHPCHVCPCAYVSQWQPLPAQPEAGVTVESLDELAAHPGACNQACSATLRAIRPLVELAQRAGGEAELAKLVEESECKLRIVAAGFNCHAHWNGCVVVGGHAMQKGFATWPEASAWAEAQAPQKEKWSEPVATLKADDCWCVAKGSGAPNWLLTLLHELTRKPQGPQSVPGMGLRSTWCACAQATLRNWSTTVDLYDPATDRVKLPE